MIITTFQYNLEEAIESSLRAPTICQNWLAGLVRSEMECASSENRDNWF